MILLVTNQRDLTSDFIVLELQRRRVSVFRLNTEDLPSSRVTFTPANGWTIKFQGRELHLAEVRAAYFRRPGHPDFSDSKDRAARDYLADEWSAVMRSLWNALEGRWLNSPFAILRAEDKPRQLTEAVAVGFGVPETLIGNDFASVVCFAETRQTIAKPLRHSLIERGDNGQVLFTSRLAPLKPVDQHAVELAPVIYQSELRKMHDIRVTVVGNRTFAVAIHSQNNPETELDWRCGSRTDLEHRPIELPEEVRAGCIQITRRLGLKFGAIDLVEDQDGRHWFLEINPNGQWAWIERRTGLPVSEAIVDELVDIAR